MHTQSALFLSTPTPDSQSRFGGLRLSGTVLGSHGLAPAYASYSKVGEALLHDEESGRRQSFNIDTGFHSTCASWFEGWIANSPRSWVGPWELWTNGAFANRPGAHSEGRALDVGHIYAYVDGAKTAVFDARYDVWRWASDATRMAKRRRYWATVASLNYYFTHVMHYLTNVDHHRHVHVDNTISGDGWGVFSTGRRSQVLSAQAFLRYIWGYGTDIDGEWSPQTDDHSRDVLARANHGGTLTSSPSHWRIFNLLAARFGSGLQTTW